MLLALTGATGFIGRYLVRELPKRGHRVRVLLRRPALLPASTASAMIGDLRQPQNMSTALGDVEAVIHSAGLAHTMSGVPEDDYRAINTEGTIHLARAARRAGVRRFIFLSSVRAQSGPTSEAVLTEAAPPAPTDAYGKSKLAAERGLADLDLDWVALRATLVYGESVKGNMAQLMRLARLPLPLPLGKLRARRSLLALDNLLAAIETALAHAEPLRRPLIVADPEALTVAEMIAAMRHGLGRPPRVFSLPEPALEWLFRAAGREDAYRRVAGSLVADPSALMRLGWQPPVATATGLARLMQTGEG